MKINAKRQWLKMPAKGLSAKVVESALKVLLQFIKHEIHHTLETSRTHHDVEVPEELEFLQVDSSFSISLRSPLQVTD